jgi:hypothetical protein
MAIHDNMGTANVTGLANTGEWTTEDTYWRSNFASRPYARADRGYEAYQPGYRYGFESANRYRGRKWDEIESDLRSGWDKVEYRGQSTWENIKDAVRDAWDRVTGDRKPDAEERTSRPTY